MITIVRQYFVLLKYTRRGLISTFTLSHNVRLLDVSFPWVCPLFQSKNFLLEGVFNLYKCQCF
jgi:hypothetical protein